MKKILLLIIITLVYSSSINAQAKFPLQSKKSHIVDPSFKYIKADRNLNARANDTACSKEVLNMAFNYMQWGDLSGLNLNGNWYQTTPEPFATTVCTNLTPGNDGTNHTITMHYDTMITDVYSKTNFGKINKANSFIQLDSLTIFGAVNVADTNNLASIANDSLIISTYLSTNGVLGAKLFDSIYTVANGGIKKFLFQGSFIGARKIKYSHKFNKGESFAIQFQYRTNKVDTGFELCYCYVDSCNTIPINGQNFSSPATRNLIYPGLVKSQSVDSTAPTTAVLFNSNNGFAYNIAGVPNNCSFIYEQMYYIIPQLTVCKELQGSLILDRDFPCYKDVATAYAIVSGGKPPYTYSWSATGVTLSATNLDSALFTMNKTGGVAINITVTDAGTPPNTITLTKTIANFTPTFASFTLAPNKTVLSGCKDSISISAPSLTNTTYLWSGESTSTTRTALAKTAGIYNVKTTFGPSKCTFDTSVTITSTYAGPPTLDFTSAPASLCVNKDVTLTLVPTAKPGWTYTFKDGASTIGTGSPLVTSFATAGSKSVTLSADSSICAAASISKTITIKAAGSTGCGFGVNIKETTADNIKIYPNPVRNGEVFIQNEMNQTINVRIIDMLGKVVAIDKVSGNKTNPVNLSNSPNGLYFVELESKGDKSIQKIVVEKQ